MMPAPAFGGPWTLEKLGILESYLNAYTTALKSQPVRPMYIDAFAGAFSFIDSDQLVAFARAVAQNAAGFAFELALETISPVAISRSVSRRGGRGFTSRARVNSSSVVLPIAETTTAICSPSTARAATRRATFRSRSTEPTDVPPYF